MPAAATSAPSGETAERNHRRRRGLHLALLLARVIEEIHDAVRARRDNLIRRRDRDRAQRRRQGHDRRHAAVKRPDAQRQIVSRADDRFAVRRERDAVDVLRMPFEHARRAARRAARAARCGPTRRKRASRRPAKRERHDRRRVSLQHRVGLLLAVAPDRDAPVRACRDGAAVSQQRDRVHGIVVEAQHLLGGVARERPADRGRIEAAGERRRAVGRNRDRAHRSAMAAQLRVRGRASANAEERQGQTNSACRIKVGIGIAGIPASCAKCGACATDATTIGPQCVVPSTVHRRNSCAKPAFCSVTALVLVDYIALLCAQAWPSMGAGAAAKLPRTSRKGRTSGARPHHSASAGGAAEGPDRRSVKAGRGRPRAGEHGIGVGPGQQSSGRDAANHAVHHLGRERQARQAADDRAAVSADRRAEDS